MNPPPVYDADGVPYMERRRGGGRRDDDPSPEVVKSAEWWAKIVILHRGKAIVLASVLTSCLTAAGYRYVGPQDDIQTLDRKVTVRIDTLAARVTRVEASVSEGAADRADIKRQLAWVIYMNCVTMRRTDPDALPEICQTPQPPRR